MNDLSVHKVLIFFVNFWNCLPVKYYHSSNVENTKQEKILLDNLFIFCYHITKQLR